MTDRYDPFSSIPLVAGSAAVLNEAVVLNTRRAYSLSISLPFPFNLSGTDWGM